MNAKQVKKLISDTMTDRKEGVSVVLSECDDHYERIEIKYPKTNDSLSLNPITEILKKSIKGGRTSNTMMPCGNQNY